MHGASPIIENAVARSLLNEVVVAFSLPSKVRAQAARASSVCCEAMAAKSKLFWYEAVLASSAFSGAQLVAARGWEYVASFCASEGNECGKKKCRRLLACVC